MNTVDTVDFAASGAPLIDRLEHWASEHGTRRVFWLSLGAFVAGEGLIGFLSLLFGGFPGAFQLSRTLLSPILCAATMVAALGLLGRGWLQSFARSAVVGAAASFPLLVAFIWVSGSGAWSNLHWSAVVVLVSTLAIAAQRLWLGDWTGNAFKRWDFRVTCVSIVVCAALIVAAIWGSFPSGLHGALSAFTLLAVIGYLLTPILRRAFRQRT